MISNEVFLFKSTTEKTYKEAVSECMELKAKLVYPPDRGTETSLSPENALLSCKNYIIGILVK